MKKNKNKSMSEDKNGDDSMRNFSGRPTQIDGHAATTEGVKISHPENEIGREQQKVNTILVAEDDDFSFFVIESTLIPYNCKVIHAKNGEEAVRIYKSQEEISLILMDIQMPVMDGFTATKEIRKVDKKVPIIAQTNFTQGENRERAFEAGCNDFISKPIDSEQLIQLIENHITIKEKDV